MSGELAGFGPPALLIAVNGLLWATIAIYAIWHNGDR